MDDFSNSRYAHSDGHTDVCFDETGSHLVTCGTDGDIRIWDGFEDDYPQSQNMGQVVTAVALKNKLLYVATDAFSVSSYTFPDIEFESVIAQYNSEVYHIVCSADGNLVASGGGDFVIKVYDTATKSLTAFRGHDGAVKSIAFDSKGKYMVSSGCDGTVRIWVLNDQECIKTLNILKKSNDMSISCPLNRLCWSPDGQYIAVPVENEVRIYMRETWESMFTLKDDCLSKDVSIAIFSPFGNYIAAAAMNGQMIVWDFTTKSCLSRKSHEREFAICGFAWNPSGKDIVFCDIEGQLGLYEKPFASSSDKAAKVDRKDIPIEFECADDDGNDMDDVNDLDVLHDKEEDDENAFDIGAIKADLEPKIFGEDDPDAIENESVKSEKVQPTLQFIEAPKPLVQKAFQPSSTPVHLERRFMLWNAVGIVRCYNTDEENSIDVEFHDANVYHPLHLDNTRNHSLAALSTEALLLACQKNEEGSSSSMLECLHFGTWDSNKEWTMEMPENENIESVALGEGFVACITDKRLLRIFTVSGVQCEIISVPGPVVCSSAWEKQLAIAYHKGLGIENDQNLNLMLIDVKLGGHCVIKDLPLPLTPKAFLSWLGYTDEGHPCIVDTSGVVNLLTTNFGIKWIPIADTRDNLKGVSDTYFVIGLSEIKQEIRCIMCKGSKYPSLLPKPNVNVIQFSLPFCEMSSDKGRLEEENRRCSITYKLLEGLLKQGFDLDSEYSSVEKKWMDILLKMFALATRTDREYRALDIAGLMPNTAVIQGAIKYATQRHKIALAERLGEVINKKLLDDEEETECDAFPVYESFNSSQNVSRSSSFRLKNSHEDNVVLKPKPLSLSKSESPRPSGSSESLLSEKKIHTGVSESSLLQSKASPISNPFKSSSKLKSAKPDDGFPSDIDSLLDNSMKNLANKSTSSTPVAKPTKKTKSQDSQSQTKLSNFTSQEKVQTKLDFQAETEAKKIGFQLYLEENRDSILCSSESELSESELIRMAMKLYKELPASEKQKYLKPTNEVQTNGTNGVHHDTPNGDTTPPEDSVVDPGPSTSDNSSKRKNNSEIEDDVPVPKKLKNTSSKHTDTTSKKLTQFAFTKKSK